MNRGNLVGADRVRNLRWDHTETYVPFRWVYMEPAVHFRKDYTEPFMYFRRYYTEFLSCKVLGKNLHYYVSPLSHLQTSSGKNLSQDAIG